ncbi:MAG: hypothetical protein WC055_01505 [Melioribacteraceae bacterium]
MKILVIDSSAEFRSLFKKLFWDPNNNNELIEAANYDDGIDILDTERPDLIIIDIFRSTSPDYSILIRFQEYLHHSVIIVFSLGLLPFQVEKVKSFGIEYVFDKWSESGKLLRLVKGGLSSNIK